MTGDFEQYYDELTRLLLAQNGRIEQNYALLSKELSQILSPYTLRDTLTPKQEKELVKKIEAVLEKHGQRLTSDIEQSIRKAWDLAEDHSDQFILKVLGVATIAQLGTSTLSKLFNRPVADINEFKLSIKVDFKTGTGPIKITPEKQAGLAAKLRDLFKVKRNSAPFEAYSGTLNLSSRVWNLEKNNLEIIKQFIRQAVAKGESAQSLSRNLKQLLNNPEALFRRVRDKEGLLRLSSRAKAYHPGQGVYRSAHQNAMRLAGTEISRAYRMAENNRWSQNPMVVGKLIRPSQTNHPIRDICDDLKGNYPKDFVWGGWHPQCRCMALPILRTEEELNEYEDKLLSGEDLPETPSRNEVTKTPQQFNEWISSNKKRIPGMKSVPYFISDNPQVVKDLL
ncbi:MAG: hypothetical protein ACOYXB_00595 [Bacteroidota bacterium]